MKKQEIKITCEVKDFLKVNQLEDFQGNLKSLSDENKQKLKNSIVEYGITVPFFVWKNNNKYYTLDGHQRLKAMSELIEEDFIIEKVPVVFIQAKNKNEAKQRLLVITSRYGEFEQDGFFAFVEDIDVLGLNINIDGMTDLLEEMETDVYDYDSIDSDNMKMEGTEYVNINIKIKASDEKFIKEKLSMGETITGYTMGKGIMRLCGLL